MLESLSFCQLNQTNSTFVFENCVSFFCRSTSPKVLKKHTYTHRHRRISLEAQRGIIPTGKAKTSSFSSTSRFEVGVCISLIRDQGHLPTAEFISDWSCQTRPTGLS
ncbi:hypothetical protein Q8A67_018317 [Cirrhinus molitorella]|uniref:Uncharacterized protein n=1 Tax=Cirrhinus molitorella TaxID=172907 RepID=A0AA88PHE9_9TELE|nr:hypothetical protein Q8A67_018317 [Cirrhinus molitorella]